MTDTGHSGTDQACRRFVIEHGHRANAEDLAFVLGRTAAEIRALRATGACRAERKGAKAFPELFRLWHGREPADEDWRPPQKKGARGGYEWLAPELAMLAGLVGQLGPKDIAGVLTERLRRLTGDPTAERSPQSVQIAINRIGLVSSDVVGGITVSSAAKEIGSKAMVHQAIDRGDLRARKVGRLLVIPHAAWAEWKAGRVFPPEGYVPLASLRAALSIKSDKLSEYARMGYVPSAVRCNPYGSNIRSTQNGSWYVSPTLAEKLVADRRAGNPMPWHGKPLEGNLRASGLR